MSNDTFAHAIFGWEVEILPEEMGQLEAIAEEFAEEDPCGNDIQETIDALLDMEPNQPGHLEMLEWLDRVSERLAAKHGIAELLAKQTTPVVQTYLRPRFVAEDCYEGCKVEPGAVVFGFGLNCFPYLQLAADPAVNELLKTMQDLKAEWLTWVT